MIPPPTPAPSVQPHDAVEKAWALRSSDPARAAGLARGLVRHGNPAIAAQAGATLAYTHLRMGQSDQAELALRAAGDAAEQARDPLARARVNVAWGAIQLSQGQYPQAVAHMNLAEQDFTRAGDDAGCAGVQMNRALAYRHLGDHAYALELLDEAVARFRAIDDHFGEALALVNTVQIYRELGDDAAARPLVERAWEVAQELGQVPFRTYVDAIRGAILASTGNDAQGRTILRECARQADSLGLPQVTGEALGNLALIVARDDPAAARELLGPALAAVAEAGDAWSVCRALLSLGDCALSAQQAREAFEQAADLATQHKDQSMARQAHRGAAEACERLNDPAGALQHWRDATLAADRIFANYQAQRLARVQVSIAHDELTAQVQRDRQRMAELVTLGRTRTDLLAMLAHDLRTPVTSTTLMAEDLALTSTDRRVHDAVVRILANQRRITRILDAVSVDAEAEQGELVLNARDDDLLLLLDLIVAEHRDAARIKRQWLQVEGRPLRLHFDAERLFHTITNLLDNAIKFSPLGATITARVLRTPGGARVEVIDSGPGIDAGHSGDLFRLFTRGPARPTAGERSTGIGLHIARRMVELHGGRIGAMPAPSGTGACFWFEIPDGPANPVTG